MTNTYDTLINDLIFEATLIAPLSELIHKIESNEFRDCDIDWLNDKLSKYTVLAMQLLGKKINLGKAIDGVMNDTNKDRFLSYFNTLLNFFKNYE